MNLFGGSFSESHQNRRLSALPASQFHLLLLKYTEHPRTRTRYQHLASFRIRLTSAGEQLIPTFGPPRMDNDYAVRTRGGSESEFKLKIQGVYMYLANRLEEFLGDPQFWV
ncbi:hypothetical protein WG66_001588 [Moniliophthora roreri]|nr:hypothetical protein WG66_001588 [Moniliophthora roreri]